MMEFISSVNLIFTCLSRFQGDNFPCDPSSLIGPRKVIDFSICSTFSCCKDSCDDFQSLYTMELKLEVPVIGFHE